MVSFSSLGRFFLVFNLCKSRLIHALDASLFSYSTGTACSDLSYASTNSTCLQLVRNSISCSTSADCQGSLCDANTSCVVLRGIGGMCATSQSCAGGRPCLNSVYVARYVAGFTCAKHTECEIGLVSGRDMSTPQPFDELGVCAVPASDGGQCTDDQQCMSLNCSNEKNCKVRKPYARVSGLFLAALMKAIYRLSVRLHFCCISSWACLRLSRS
jgi:hypothetical protein